MHKLTVQGGSITDSSFHSYRGAYGEHLIRGGSITDSSFHYHRGPTGIHKLTVREAVSLILHFREAYRGHLMHKLTTRGVSITDSSFQGGLQGTLDAQTDYTGRQYH